MIIRRMADAVREQNWFTVIIEIFIVVIGIFLGLQVTEWNNARNEIQDQINIEYRLLNDFTLLLNEVNGAIQFSEETIEGLSAVQAAMEAGVISDNAKQAFETGLLRGQAGFSLANQSSTYAEIQSSGRLDLIKNEKTRIVLGRVVGNFTARFTYFRDIYETMSRAGVAQVFIKHRDLEPLWRDEAGNLALGPIKSYDLNAMIDDDEMHAAVKFAVEMHTWAHSELIAQKRDIETVITALKESNE